MARFVIPITISIFTAMLVVAGLLAGTLIAYTHINYDKQATIAAQNLMKRAANTLELKVAELIEPIDSIVSLSPDWPDVETAPDPDGHPSRARFIELIRSRSQIASIYLAFKNGDFYLIGKAAARPEARLKEIGAPDGTAILEQIVLRDQTSVRMFRRFMDADGKLLSETEGLATFDPRSRPWYQKAVSSPRTVRTDVYKFAGTGEPGLTISRRSPAGVMSIDITMQDLKSFLDREPQAANGVLALLKRDGDVLVHSSIAQHGNRLPDDKSDGGNAVLQAMKELVETSGRDQDKTAMIAGKPWLVHLGRIPFGGDTTAFFAVAMPQEVIAAPIRRVTRNTLIVAILIVVVSVPVIWLVSRLLSIPLIDLALDANRIGRFDLTGGGTSNSSVVEIRTLQRAIDNMRRSLQAFSTYMPKDLVRQLLERNEGLELGGTKRPITVMFTDLENFTAMSAELDPEELMRRMSAYFEAVTTTLLDHGATIDKYVGDAVMAIWNAPNDTEDHVARACQAALALLESGREITQDWLTDGPAVRTRIGIHHGEAVVGNVGSSDRMNYTALGATVNLAARLETLNRGKATEILVSDVVRNELAGRFEFRKVGQTTLKGFSEPITVYELLGETSVDGI